MGGGASKGKGKQKSGDTAENAKPNVAKTAAETGVPSAGSSSASVAPRDLERQPMPPSEPKAPNSGKRFPKRPNSKNRSSGQLHDEGSVNKGDADISPSSASGSSDPVKKVEGRPRLALPRMAFGRQPVRSVTHLDDEVDDEVEQACRPQEVKTGPETVRASEEVRAPRAPPPLAVAPVSPGTSAPTSPPVTQRKVSPEELIAACRGGDTTVVKQFLAMFARTSKGLSECEEVLFDSFGESVLHHAVRNSSERVLDLLLDMGRVQVDIPNARSETALQLACRKGDVNIVRRLLQADADPDRRDANGLTPFLSAVFTGAKEETLELLVSAQANVSMQDDRGVGALHFASLHGDTYLQRWLLQHKAEIDSQTEHRTTPLMIASKRGLADTVSLFLDNRANTALTDEAGCTALMQALSAGHAEIAAKILDTGVSADSVDCAGRSALFHAVLGAQVDGLNVVISRGGRVNMLDHEDRSPLYQGCLMGEPALVTCLLNAKADPNLAGRASTMRAPPALQEDGEEDGEDGESGAARACLQEARTCLQVCAALAHNDLLLSMLEHKAEVNAAPGALGWTAIHLCAAVGNDVGAASLLSGGASPDLEDMEGNTARMLAERANQAEVLALFVQAQAATPEAAGPSSPSRRQQARSSLPPIHAGALDAAPPSEELPPLALFEDEWLQRRPDGSLLDRVCGPMVSDALKSDQWRDRWEALTHLTSHLPEVSGSPSDVVCAVTEILLVMATDKVSKVVLAALGLFEELLSDARADMLSSEEFVALIRAGQQRNEDPARWPNATKVSGSRDVLIVLLDHTDAAGGSSHSNSPQQAAAKTLCSCVLHGRVPLDEVAFPLMRRIDVRLHGDLEKNDKSMGPRCISSNLKLLGRLLSAFGLQQCGIFRRALVLPLLIRGVACEQARVRTTASEVLVSMVALSGGVEERIWALLQPKARKVVQKVSSGQEGIRLMTTVPCEEDALPRKVVVAEDDRASSFLCVSELTPQVWNGLQRREMASPSARAAVAAAAAASPKPGEPGGPPADESVAKALQRAFTSKNWKERAECIAALAGELASMGDGVRLIEDSIPGLPDAIVPCGPSGPLLSQYVLRGHRLSDLQGSLTILLADVVTAVFCAAAELLRLTACHVPLYIAPLFLEPLLPVLVGRLLDTSNKVRAKALESCLEIAAIHSCALCEMFAQWVASGSAWSSAPSGCLGGLNNERGVSGRDVERCTGPRLQLLVAMVTQAQQHGSAGTWAEETWQFLADYAVQASEHRSGDVRKEAAALLATMKESGDRAAVVGTRSEAHLQFLAQQRSCKRPFTGSTGRLTTGRLTTGNTRLGTGATRSSKMSSSGRLATSMRIGTSKNSSLKNLAPDPEESDNSVHSEPGGLNGTLAGDIAFFDVQTACPGGDEVPDLVDGEAALAEALPLAEVLDDVALDFVAPLIALFGDGWTRCFYSRNWQCRGAALLHLCASMSRRVEEMNVPEVTASAINELLDGAMRAVHEGLGDQNVRVYAEACRAVSAVVPCFCGIVDGRLLVAHLAPLLRQLCARMGDSKEAVRHQTTQALFRLLHPPVGDIVSPVALATLILRHLVSSKDTGSSPPVAPNPTKVSKGVAAGWLCRIGALRDLVKEYPKTVISNPGTTSPGEWTRLKDGLGHIDPVVRYESARLYALSCKTHVHSLGDEAEQMAARKAWCDALPEDVPAKSIAQVRKLLKVPAIKEAVPEALSVASRSTTFVSWEVPDSLVCWAGCSAEELEGFRFPGAEDESAVLQALRALGKASCSPVEASRRPYAAKPDEAFDCICRAVQQALASPVGAKRRVFLTAVDLLATAVVQLAPLLSGLGVNIGLAKTFPILLDRSSKTNDVKFAVCSDKLVQQLAKHPKVGCEAVTKMVITAIARAEKPLRPLMLLRTLLGEFGLRLAAQGDIVMLLLNALACQLEALGTQGKDEEHDIMRSQLTGVLATCHQFAPETVRYCMSEVDPTNRKFLLAALQEAPNPRMAPLGASAAIEDEMEGGVVAGSAVRAASRGRERGQSPRPGGRGASPRGGGERHLFRESSPRNRVGFGGFPPQPPFVRGERSGLPPLHGSDLPYRLDDCSPSQRPHNPSGEPSPRHDSPGNRRQRRRDRDRGVSGDVGQTSNLDPALLLRKSVFA